MRIAETHHKIAELTIKIGFPLHKILGVHKVEFEKESPTPIRVIYLQK